MHKINFRPYIKVYLKEKESQVTISRPFTDNNIGKVYDLSEVGLAVFRQIGKGMSLSEITATILAQFPYAAEEVQEIFEILFAEKYIEETVPTTDPSYLELETAFGRLLPIWAEFETEEVNRYQIQRNVMSKRVGVIGCGTIGFGVVSKLVASGVKNFVLFDPDVVEETNLSRQTLFALSDIGFPKTEVVKRHIMDRTRGANVVTYQNTLEKESDLEVLGNVDLVVVAGDYPSYLHLGYLVQEFCFKKGIPISFAGGYRGHVGKIYPLVIPYQTACFHCLHEYFSNDVEELGERIVNEAIKVSTTAQMGDFLTSIVSFEILKLLTGVIPLYLVNKVMLIDLSVYHTTELFFEKAPDCPHCSKLAHTAHE